MRAELYQEWKDLYEEDFSSFKIKACSPGRRWLLVPTAKATHQWAEVVILHTSIYVGGDFFPTIFNHHPSMVEQTALNWAATSELDYLSKKVHLARGEELKEFDPSLISHDLLQHAEYYQEQYYEGENEVSVILKRLAKTPFSMYDHPFAVQELIMDELAEYDCNVWEWVGNVGMRFPRKLFKAHAVLKRLKQLVDDGERP